MKRLLVFLLLATLAALTPAQAQIPGGGGNIVINTTPVVGGTPGNCLTITGANKVGSGACGGAGGITVGTTAIASGTNTRVLFDNAGTLGEYAVSGTGSVAMTNSPAFTTPDLGTPSAATLTNAAGLPISTGVSGLGAGIATFLATPTSANLGAAVTDGLFLLNNANLGAIGGLTSAADKGLYFTGAGTAATFDFSASGRNLANIGGVTNRIAYTSSANTWSQTAISTSGRSLINIGGTQDRLAYTSSLDTWSLTPFTAAMRTFMTTSSSANLAALLTDETGTGVAVFDTAPAISAMTRSVSAAVSAAGSTQGTGTALTSDYNVVTTVGSGQGVVLPTATAGRTVSVVNKGANALLVYPASGGAVDALATDAAISLAVNGVLDFYASSTTQWYSTSNGSTAISQVTGLGTGVATALAVNVGTAGAFVVNGGALGTPSSGTLTNATGLPISTGVSGLGAGVATFLATPSSANLAAAVTDETGTAGSLVFSASPTFTGTLAAANITNGGTFVQTSASATAFTSGPNGSTNPVFTLVNNTASAVAGVRITGAATGGNVQIDLTDSGSNTNLRIDAKGTGTITLGNTSTGNISLSRAATGVSLSVTGNVTAYSGTAIPAGGTTGSGYTFSSTSNFGTFFGSGAPTLSAAQGSLYLRSDGTPYYNTNGTTGWQSLLPSGSWVLITSTTASSSSTVDFTGFNSALYNQYQVVFWGMKPSANSFCYMLTSTNGGSSYDSGASDYLMVDFGMDASGYVTETQAISSAAYFSFSNNFLATTNFPAFGVVTLYSPQTAQYSAITVDVSFESGSTPARTRRYQPTLYRQSAADVDAIRFACDSGATISVGEYRFYGRRI